MFSFLPSYNYGYDPLAQARAQALAAQRQRARSYLPHEFVDDYDSYPRYDYGLNHRYTSPKRQSPSPTRRVPVSSPRPTESRRSASPARPVGPSIEDQTSAASKIQHAYRVHKSLSDIAAIELKFEAVEEAFVWPDVIDFQAGDQIVSVSTADASSSSSSSSSFKPKLAFTSHNTRLLAHIESLSRLLTSLDAVESWGDKHVRSKRKALVRRIEKSLQDLEGFEDDADEGCDLEKGWRGLWRRFNRQAKQPPHEDEPQIPETDDFVVL
ncbi:hypothetical protein C8J56DRAFT_884681 [Mycena floridula]|nr:hypothetical protein C8J56DRAFT_884681 [Mycena floridula]